LSRGVAAAEHDCYDLGVASGDRERWNERHAREPAGEPSRFVTGLEAVLPRRGRAIDVGGGTGRHALWLARRGLEVTLADVSDVALGMAASAARGEGLPFTAIEVDLETVPLPAGPWDVIVCTYFLHRPLFDVFPVALAPGGWLVFAHATRTNLERNPRPGPRHLLEDGEIRALVHGLEIVRCEEAWFEEGRHEARLVARRPPVSGR
jgi:tellurite methyltransferase